MRRLLIGALAGLLVLPTLAWSDDDDDICNSALGTVSAEITNDPGFEGLYKYTITLTKNDEDEDDGLGFFLLLDLGTCDCVCDEDFIVFPPIAGTIPGDDSDDDDEMCDITGEFLCIGSPELPSDFNGPAIKFNQAEDDDCDGDDDFESATVCFYTAQRPANCGDHDIVLIDDDDDDDGDGDNDDADEEDGSCTGVLTGCLLVCDCTLDADADTWGGMKKRYQDHN